VAQKFRRWLWIDEMRRAFASAGSSGDDGCGVVAAVAGDAADVDAGPGERGVLGGDIETTSRFCRGAVRKVRFEEISSIQNTTGENFLRHVQAFFNVVACSHNIVIKSTASSRASCSPNHTQSPSRQALPANPARR